MRQMTPTTQHRQVTRIVVVNVVVYVRQRQHFFAIGMRMHLPVLDSTLFTRPIGSSLPQVA